MFGVNISQCVSKTASDQQQRPCAKQRPCVCPSIGWDCHKSDMDIIQTAVHASTQAHQRLVLLVDLLAMGPLNPDESVRYDGGA
jgi:hypothetical protein